jgi:hypothetical protein
MGNKISLVKWDISEVVGESCSSSGPVGVGGASKNIEELSVEVSGPDVGVVGSERKDTQLFNVVSKCGISGPPGIGVTGAPGSWDAHPSSD